MRTIDYRLRHRPSMIGIAFVALFSGTALFALSPFDQQARHAWA
jgi:hypothetical protein